MARHTPPRTASAEPDLLRWGVVLVAADARAWGGSRVGASIARAVGVRLDIAV